MGRIDDGVGVVVIRRYSGTDVRSKSACTGVWILVSIICMSRIGDGVRVVVIR